MLSVMAAETNFVAFLPKNQEPSLRNMKAAKVRGNVAYASHDQLGFHFPLLSLISCIIF